MDIKIISLTKKKENMIKYLNIFDMSKMMVMFDN